MVKGWPISRRSLLAAPLATLLPREGPVAAAVETGRRFLWGASTSATQIEGAATEDGRGPSIWDRFAAEPGRIADGSTPAVACDHYHRWQGDIGLMRELGINAYRFSIAWPRVMPSGRGGVNPPGIAFYDRLVDGLLAAGILPMPCLYHWDLPWALHQAGGWLNRDCAGWFADYAAVVVRRLGDRVAHWFMLNEPSVQAMFGYAMGEHAPGLNGGAPAFLAALHNQNRAQGLALRALRAAGSDFELGTVLSLQPTLPDSDDPADRQAAIRWDAVWNRLALDGLLRGLIPDALAPAMSGIVKPGDLEGIRFPIDLLGVNYYSKMTVRHQPGALFDVGWGRPRTDRFTAMGWPVQPEGLFELLMELKQLYGNPKVMITENGAAYEDRPDAAGVVADTDRIAFLHDHVGEVRRAITAGCNVSGYFVWSLLDNFEWQSGYARRFGLVYVDYPTQRRIPKQSFRWYRSVVQRS